MRMTTVWDEGAASTSNYTMHLFISADLPSIPIVLSHADDGFSASAAGECGLRGWRSVGVATTGEGVKKTTVVRRVTGDPMRLLLSVHLPNISPYLSHTAACVLLRLGARTGVNGGDRRVLRRQVKRQ
jgi:hypothetical protein